MLRANLSTRPFYNERLVHAVLAVVAIAVAAALAFEAVAIVRLSRQNTELSAAIQRDRADADQLARQAAETRRRIDSTDLRQVASAAAEANALIQQRTFSWTAFFNDIEQTLPENVMLLSVRPDVRDEATKVTMEVVGKRTEDIEAFMRQLEKTGHFHDVLPPNVQVLDDGSERVTLVAAYTPAAEGTARPAAASTREPRR
ncbi:MAG TPA: PilN domain-containing protein [Vicinamibacterales bacterium]|nr:PilN domain-containing protein [Vicinamibacterales bacterium]